MLLEILTHIHVGEEVVSTEGGKPTAKIMPFSLTGDANELREMRPSLQVLGNAACTTTAPISCADSL